MPKALVMNSSGKDSLAVIHLTKSEYELTSLYIDVGQRNTVVALPASKLLADAHCGGRHVTLTLSGGNFLFTSEKIGITVAHQAAMLHSIAASYAVANGFSTIISGQRRGAADPLFFDVTLPALLESSKITVPPTFLFPVKQVTTDFVFDTIKGDPLWWETVTCNDYPACGICGRCVIRASWLSS